MPRKMRDFFDVWWYAIISAIGIASFIVSLQSQPSDSNPSGEAGFYAAIIAMCVAAIALTESVVKPKYPKLVKVVMGIGVCASAYLWVSAEAKVHPLAPELGWSWLVLFIAMSIFTLFVPILALALGLLGHGNEPDTDNSDSVD